MQPNALTPSLIVSTRRPKDGKPRVSVAVSTYQRAAMLPRLFEALEGQTLPLDQFELVLVDDGSTPETAEVIRKLTASSELRVHAMRVEPNGGPAFGRNFAWREARADVVAFTDDDCAPAPQWLETGLRSMLTDDAVVVGQTLPDPDLPLGPFSRTMRVDDVNWLPTCNVFYKHEDLEAVGGFDESFLEGGEDTDLALRVRDQRGREFRFVPGALVYHDVRPSRFLDAARETLRWKGVPRFFRLHPAARERLHRGVFWKPSHPKVLLATTGLALGPVWPPAIVLTLPWLYYRTRVRKPAGRRRVAYPSLPGTFVIDLLETVTMIRGSMRHRTLVL